MNALGHVMRLRRRRFAEREARSGLLEMSRASAANWNAERLEIVELYDLIYKTLYIVQRFHGALSFHRPVQRELHPQCETNALWISFFLGFIQRSVDNTVRRF
jgi:hypothetical protein